MFEYTKLDDDIDRWLSEDVPFWDISSVHLPDNIQNAKIIAKQDGIVSGIHVVIRIFEKLNVKVFVKVKEGQIVHKGDVIMDVSGNNKQILEGERVALNILSHMSGIATYTNNLVTRIKKHNPKCRLAATRKTLPGLRVYEKWAVQIGGGDTHRMSLSSMVMLKENHIAAYGGIITAMEIIREKTPFSSKIEIEVRTDEEARLAAVNKADIIMLDNYKPADIYRILPDLRGIYPTVLVEASGNINEDNIEDYAKTGVDIISMGRLTHSAIAFDFSLLFKGT